MRSRSRSDVAVVARRAEGEREQRSSQQQRESLRELRRAAERADERDDAVRAVVLLIRDLLEQRRVLPQSGEADRDPRNEHEHEGDGDREACRPDPAREREPQRERPQEELGRNGARGRSRRSPRRVAIAPEKGDDEQQERADRPVLDRLARERPQKRDRVAAPVPDPEQPQRPGDACERQQRPDARGDRRGQDRERDDDEGQERRIARSRGSSRSRRRPDRACARRGPRHPR